MSSDLSKAQKRQYNSLVRSARDKKARKDFAGALSDFQEAQLVFPSDKLSSKIESLRGLVASFEEQANGYIFDPAEKEYRLADGFRIPAKLYGKLFDYQQDGVKWLWEHVHCVPKGGCVFGDDMGLGKTVQTCSFLASLFRISAIRFVLIVLETSLIEQWKAELRKWLGNVSTNIYVYHNKRKAQRQVELEDFYDVEPGICITTYGLVSSDTEAFLRTDDEGNSIWDYVILDEGHRIRNHKTKLAQCVREIPSEHRVLLSGTPLTNNLLELWSIYDYVCQGELFGDEDEFKRKFSLRIETGLKKDASRHECDLGNKTAIQLRETIAPHLLHRKKSEIFPSSSTSASSSSSSTDKENETSASSSSSSSALKAPMPVLTARKNDFIVYITPSQLQVSLYQSFLETKEVRLVLAKSKSPLAAITILKKIAVHPRLLSKEMKLLANVDLTNIDTPSGSPSLASLLESKTSVILPKHGRSDDVDEDNDDDDDDENETEQTDDAEEDADAQFVAQLVSQSGKMMFLIRLLQKLKCEGHRTLVFSQSRKMLDIIQRVIVSQGISFVRIDGTVVKSADRQQRIREFDRNKSISCFLLTTKVGGVGLNLVSADRVVIFDPSWTTIDDQATDRVFRLGQTRNVVVYRLISCGTIEEKIYRKQIFKGSLMKSVMEEKKLCQYFTGDELANLFRLDNVSNSDTMADLNSRYEHMRQTDEELDGHLGFLRSLGIVGLSDHNLLFTDSRGISAEEATTMQNTVSSPATSDMSKTPRSRRSKQPLKRSVVASPIDLRKASEQFVDLTLEDSADDIFFSSRGSQRNPRQSPHELHELDDSVDRHASSEVAVDAAQEAADSQEELSFSAYRSDDVDRDGDDDDDDEEEEETVGESEPSDAESIGDEDSQRSSDEDEDEDEDDSFVVKDHSYLELSLDSESPHAISATPHKKSFVILDDEDESEDDDDHDEDNAEDQDDCDGDEGWQGTSSPVRFLEANEHSGSLIEEASDHQLSYSSILQTTDEREAVAVSFHKEEEEDVLDQASSLVLEPDADFNQVESSFASSTLSHRVQQQSADEAEATEHVNLGEDSSLFGSFDRKEFFSQSFDDYIPNPEDVPEEVMNLLSQLEL